MSDMNLEGATISIALQTLDIQYDRIWSTRVGSKRDSQMNYYTGMKQMMEILLSNAFKTELTVSCDEKGKHYIVGIDMGKEAKRNEAQSQA